MRTLNNNLTIKTLNSTKGLVWKSKRRYS